MVLYEYGNRKLQRRRRFSGVANRSAMARLNPRIGIIASDLRAQITASTRSIDSGPVPGND